MKRNSYFQYCIIATLAASAPMTSLAAVRRPNRADTYSQINAMIAAQQYVDDTYYADAPSADDLPVRVGNAAMADTIAAGGTYNSVGASDLESCSRIYPDGEFAWDRPTVGRGAGGAMTCVAVVEMRSTDPVKGGTEKNVVLARAYVAAGDAVKCNISDFPEYSYTQNADESVFTFPRDAEPTRQDVINVMNDEQKQNAGLKIAALAVVGAVGGNIAGKNEVGHDGLFGGGKHKLQSTAIGAAAGAALGAGSVYSGKVAGDMILSTGVNAAAGATVGNMIASGDDVLRIEDCNVNGRNTTCLWGRVVRTTDIDTTKQKAFYDFTNTQKTMLCDIQEKNGETKFIKCTDTQLLSVKLEAYSDILVDQIEDMNFQKVTSDLRYHIEKTDNGNTMVPGEGGESVWTPIAQAGIPGKEMAAMIADVKDKAFGLKRSDWGKMRSTIKREQLVARNGKGIGTELKGDYEVSDFYPMYVSSEDGGIIDFSNKARMKGTLIGAGAGGALGAFTAYQGAKNDIENRWAEAVREYKDSLQKVYCATGNRFLSFYNDMVTIPILK